MNWDDLRVFLAVARAGTVSGAGRALGVRHSTVSRRLHGLEEQLGVQLVERAHGGYRLTPAGEDLKGAAARMESEALAVDGSLLGRDKELRGPVRVTVVTHIAESLLMPMFASFSRDYPSVDLQIQGSNVYRSLAQRESDVAIRVTAAPGEALLGTRMARFASAPYGSRSYVEHLRASGESPTWLGTECCEFHRRWTRELSSCDRHAFTVDETVLAKAALKENLGLTVLPCFVGDLDPELERYADPIPEHQLDLWFLVHSDLARSARVRVLREHLLEQIDAARDLIEGR